MTWISDYYIYSKMLRNASVPVLYACSTKSFYRYQSVSASASAKCDQFVRQMDERPHRRNEIQGFVPSEHIRIAFVKWPMRRIDKRK